MPVPFEIHRSSGILTVSTGPSKDWKSTYNLEVVAKDDDQEISTAVIIHVTKDPKDDASLDLFSERLNELPETLEFSVIENVEGKILSAYHCIPLMSFVKHTGALVANLSILHEHKRKGAVTEHLIANHEARDKFILSDSGLLFTNGALDREERDSYMVTIVLGRKGIIRGKQAVQVKVWARARHYLPIQFNIGNDSIHFLGPRTR